MNKKICALMLLISMLISLVPAVYAAPSRLTAVAAYGTPVIDGEIDDVWAKTNYNAVTNCNKTGVKYYKGWFKVLWDESYIYVLGKQYTTQFNDNHSDAWYHDSMDVYIDENMKRTNGYENGDYQVRCNFKDLVTGNNYKDFTKMKAKSKKLDDSFIIEMAISLETVTPHEGLKMGFEVLMTAAAMPGVEMREYLWNCTNGWKYNNTDCYGNIQLAKSVEAEAFNEPEFVRPAISGGFKPIVQQIEKRDEASLLSGTNLIGATEGIVAVDNVSVKVDDKDMGAINILHSDENPMIEINDLAYAIGGRVENGDTLIADGKSYKFKEGSPLAEDAKGHLIMDRDVIRKDGKLYVPATCVIPFFQYLFHYNRFDKLIKIHMGKNYPAESEFKVFYAKDFGAVGDGVHKDGAAIIKATNAAMTHDGPAKVMLEPNKTYLVEPRIDSLHFLYIDDKENLIFDGCGSTILFEKPANQFAYINNCANVHIRNLTADYKEAMFTYGVVQSVNKETRKIRVEIPEGHPLPAANEWAQHFWSGDASYDAWWYVTVMDGVESRIKWGVDQYMGHIAAVDKVEGRIYDITMETQQKIEQATPGDRISIFTRCNGYDVKPDYNSPYRHGNYQVNCSGDIYLENVTMYYGMWHTVNMGLNWGNVYMRNYNMLNKEGEILSNISDGVHTWRCRGGVIIEDSRLETNLDDQGNAKGEAAFVASRIDDYTYTLVWDQLYEVGDELIFVDKRDKCVIGRAFITNVVKNWDNNFTVTVDRVLSYDKVVTQEMTNDQWEYTFAWNVNATTIGTVVRNTEYVGGRRYPMLLRAPYSVIEDNTVINCGSGFCCSDEIFAHAAEGSFPSFSTFRGNYTYQDDCIKPDFPFSVVTSRSDGNSTASIQNFLIENNVIETKIDREAIVIEHVDGLYMYNNKLINNREEGIKTSTTPILVSYSRIADIDGIDFTYKMPVDAAATFVGCIVPEGSVKNIKVNEGNTALPFVSYEK